MLQAAWNFVYDNARDELGIPGRLLNLLRDCPEMRIALEEPSQSVHIRTVPAWHEWGYPRNEASQRRSPGWTHMWKGKAFEWRAHAIHIPALEKFGITTEMEQWTGEIQDVQGLSASRSDLTKFCTLDDFVMTHAPEMVDEISEAKLQENLAHNEFGIFNESASNIFVSYRWDGRVFLCNSDGSHHFAAARLIARRLGKRVLLKGRHYSYSINPMAVDELRRDFAIYVINGDSHISNRFHEAMRSFSAAVIEYPMSAPFEKTVAILLPKDNLRSARVSKILRRAGMFDLGQYLNELCQRQSEMEGRFAGKLDQKGV